MKIAVFQHFFSNLQHNLGTVVVTNLGVAARIKVIVTMIGVAKMVLSAAIEIVQKVSHQTMTAAINHRYQKNQLRTELN